MEQEHGAHLGLPAARGMHVPAGCRCSHNSAGKCLLNAATLDSQLTRSSTQATNRHMHAPVVSYQGRHDWHTRAAKRPSAHCRQQSYNTAIMVTAAMPRSSAHLIDADPCAYAPEQQLPCLSIHLPAHNRCQHLGCPVHTHQHQVQQARPLQSSSCSSKQQPQHSTAHARWTAGTRRMHAH